MLLQITISHLQGLNVLINACMSLVHFPTLSDKVLGNGYLHCVRKSLSLILLPMLISFLRFGRRVLHQPRRFHKWVQERDDQGRTRDAVS